MKKATRVLSLTMAAAMAAGVLGGCSSSAQGGTASTADTSSAASTTASSADSGNVIRVGVVCSMTGGSAIYGEGAQNAVDMAVEEITPAIPATRSRSSTAARWLTMPRTPSRP